MINDSVHNDRASYGLPHFFILESLPLDEEQIYCQGRILADILRMSGKTVEYYFFRTEFELDERIKRFADSHFRYLHIATHGTGSTINLAMGNPIEYQDFAAVLNGVLNKRRLFLSACSVGNKNVADLLAKANPGMFSFVAPTGEIEFKKTAVFWGAFYIKLFELDEAQMKWPEMKIALNHLCRLLNVPMFFGRHNDALDWQYGTLPELMADEMEGGG